MRGIPAIPASAGSVGCTPLALRYARSAAVGFETRWREPPRICAPRPRHRRATHPRQLARGRATRAHPRPHKVEALLRSPTIPPSHPMSDTHPENSLRLTDFMDVQTLQEIQDSFAAVANVKA